MVNFIKVGGVEGFIKRQYEVEVIEAGSLPLGIVDEMTPKITRAHLISGDMVVLVSDGVTDSFGDRVALGNFINNIDGTLRRDDITNAQKPTPQYIADEIIAEVLRRTDKIAIDDCTVLVAQIV
jgi:stage II sporulation protein E